MEMKIDNNVCASHSRALSVSSINLKLIRVRSDGQNEKCLESKQNIYELLLCRYCHRWGLSGPRRHCLQTVQGKMLCLNRCQCIIRNLCVSNSGTRWSEKVSSDLFQRKKSNRSNESASNCACKFEYIWLKMHINHNRLGDVEGTLTMISSSGVHMQSGLSKYTHSK